MTRLFIVCFVLVLIPLKGMANTVLHVSFHSGDTWEIALSEKPTIIFEDNLMIFETKKQSIKFVRNDIRDFDFRDSTGSVSDITSDQFEIEWLNQKTIAIKGSRSASDMHLYDISGIKCNIDSINNGDDIIVNFNNLDSGIYILFINNKKSIKIQIK